MKKLLIILGSLLALVIVGAFIASFFLGAIVTKGINTFGPKVTGTPVTLASATISPVSGSGTLNGLFVGNPPGWKSDQAFSFAKVHVSVAPGSLLGDHIAINEVVIDGPAFVYETRIVTSNLQELLANIEKNTGGPSAKPADQPAAPDGPARKYSVKSFRLENATVTLGFGPSAITVPMPPLVITELGTREGGLTANQLSVQVLARVLTNITQAVAQSALKIGAGSGENAIDKATQKAGEGLKKLFGTGKDK